MPSDITIATIAAGSAIAGGAITQAGAYALERTRFRQTTRAARVDETRGVIEAAAVAYVHARMALDDAILGNTKKIDSTNLLGALLEHWAKITLRLNSRHPITATYREALDRWVEAVTKAREPRSAERNESIATARNAAEAAHVRFLDAAAPFVGPDAPALNLRRESRRLNRAE